jgi:hypothetical protein
VPRTLRSIQTTEHFVTAETSPTTIVGAVDSTPTVETGIDDFSRKVYGDLGIPIDAIEFPSLLNSMAIAADDVAPFMISTTRCKFLGKEPAERRVSCSS